MKLIVIGSSSKGNGYALISSSNEILLLEAGVKARKMIKAIDYASSQIVGCLVSHQHGDHAGQLKDYAKYGFLIAANEDVLSKKAIPEHQKYPIEEGKTYQFGRFKVSPFNIKHDVPTLGFLIRHEECGSILFATDCAHLPYVFKNVNHFIIEANYSDEILEQRILKGEEQIYRKRRLLATHMEISQTIKSIGKCNPENTRTITLIHLSADNGDPAMFHREVARKFSIPTYIAKPNVVINL